MKRILKIASAFIGILVGAGFASGQETMFYFVSFGNLGTIGAIISVAIFAYLGMILMKLGSRTQTDSHQEVIYKICGRFLGCIIDYVLNAILFGIGIVMIAGSGSIFDQQFGLPSFIGTILMTVLVMITVMLKVDRVIKVIASVTPFLILVVLFLFIYSMFTMNSSFTSLEPHALEQNSAAGHWLISTINYISITIAMGASMTLVMGGNEPDERISSIGGLTGGIALGLLLIISHLTIFSNINTVSGLDIPMLGIANSISPLLGILYSLVLFAMIFNTAVSMFYSFGTRFSDPQTTKFKVIVISSLLIGFIASFFGFTKLVSSLYPIFGYMGIVLIIVLIITPFRMSRLTKEN